MAYPETVRAAADHARAAGCAVLALPGLGVAVVEPIPDEVRVVLTLARFEPHAGCAVWQHAEGAFALKWTVRRDADGGLRISLRHEPIPELGAPRRLVIAAR